MITVLLYRKTEQVYIIPVTQLMLFVRTAEIQMITQYQKMMKDTYKKDIAREGNKMTKSARFTAYNKYGGRCAYCGREINFKDMQVDHIDPKRRYFDPKVADSPINLNPSCRRCNHYKRAHNLEMFRHMLKTLHDRVRDIYICKVAEDYGIIKIEPWDGKFYFEKGEN